jgi:hypothetical protein
MKQGDEAKDKDDRGEGAQREEENNHKQHGE